MFSKNRFKSKYVEHGLTAVEVARIMKISTTTLYRKINGETDFTRREIQRFQEELRLNADEIAHIFFG